MEPKNGKEKNRSQRSGASQQPCETKRNPTQAHEPFIRNNHATQRSQNHFSTGAAPSGAIAEGRIGLASRNVGSQATAEIASMTSNNLLAPISACRLTSSSHGWADLHSERRCWRSPERATRRAVDLVRHSRPPPRGVAEERREIDPAVVVREIGAFAKASFPQSLKIQVHAPENLAPIVGSAGQLHRALLNLCVNARDAMPDGGTLTIRAANVSFDPSQTGSRPRHAGRPRYMLFEVSDTGSGIPEAILEKIFDPFFTTKGPGKGTGLGLASVRSIVESHAGLLSVQTENARKGTTFHILDFPPVNRKKAFFPVVGDEIRIVADVKKMANSTPHRSKSYDRIRTSPGSLPRGHQHRQVASLQGCARGRWLRHHLSGGRPVARASRGHQGIVAQRHRHPARRHDCGRQDEK